MICKLCKELRATTQTGVCLDCLKNKVEDTTQADNLVNTLITAGWEKICESIRAAGSKVIENPRRAIDALRQTADALEGYERSKKHGTQKPPSA